jgi:hypothetical protein
MAQLRMNPYYEVLLDVSVASRNMTKLSSGTLPLTRCSG